MKHYAENTEVTAERSRSEIIRTLDRYGADAFSYGWEPDKAGVRFRMKGKLVQMILPLPSRDSQEFRFTPSRGLERSEKDALTAWEQACRQRWRALSLVIKARLEAVATGISTFEEEFLAFLVLPDNQTVGQYLLPQVERAYETGVMPPVLPWDDNSPRALPAGDKDRDC